jgi:uncharacterized protein (DUF4213/DUF364 family)
MAMPFPGKLAGRRAADLAREALSGHGIRRAVGIAAVNALADYCWQSRPNPMSNYARASMPSTPPKSAKATRL